MMVYSCDICSRRMASTPCEHSPDYKPAISKPLTTEAEVLEWADDCWGSTKGHDALTWQAKRATDRAAAARLAKGQRLLRAFREYENDPSPPDGDGLAIRLRVALKEES